MKRAVPFWGWVITTQIQYYNNESMWITAVCFAFAGLILFAEIGENIQQMGKRQ